MKAEAAERLWADKRWLPNVLRLPQRTIEKKSPPTYECADGRLFKMAEFWAGNFAPPSTTNASD